MRLGLGEALEERDRVAGIGQQDRSGLAGDAATDDGNISDIRHDCRPLFDT